MQVYSRYNTSTISNYKTDWKKYKKVIIYRNNELEKEEFIRGELENVETRYKYINDIIREEVYKASGKKEEVKKIENKNKEEEFKI